MVRHTESMTPEADSERRGDTRRRVLKHVQVMSLDRKSSSIIDCKLRNVSRSGAQLFGSASSVSRIPAQCYLVAPGQLRMIRCKVVWKSYDAVGIRFLSDPGQLASELTACSDHDASGADGRESLGPSSDPASDLTEETNVNSAEQEFCGASHGTVTPADGLAPLIRDDGSAEIVPYGRQFCLLPIERLGPGSSKLRKGFEQAELEDLARSIREKGLLQPLIVRRIADGEDYEIVAGERRWRAAQLAEIREIPVLIRELSDAEALEIALVENVQRRDLNALEEAQGYGQLMERYGYTQQMLASAVGKSRSHVANMLRLLSLPDEVKGHLETGRLTAGHARTLVASDGAVELANHIIERNLNVRESERLAAGSQQGSRADDGKKRPEKESELGDLERRVSEALGLKVDIVGAGPSQGRIVVHVRTAEQLNEVCRRLVRPD